MKHVIISYANLLLFLLFYQLGIFGLGLFIKAEEGKTISSDLRVMSFNIRLGVANDGANHWERRKDLVVRTIKEFRPDILGLQEVWPIQETYLKKKFTDYHYYGRSRRIDPNEGEQCGVMYRKDRFKVLEQKTFWLSEKPDQAESKSWDSSLPRIANWVSLQDRLNKGKDLVLINVHFDHKGRESREQAAKLIKRRVSKLGRSARIVITGDFNAGEGSAPYRALVDESLIDTFRLSNPKRMEEEATLSGWNGRTVGNRIDWVLCTPNFKVLTASIDRTQFNGRYPSDHYPVSAILQVK